MVTSHERSVEIDAPVGQAYDAISDVSAYPRFLRGIREVRRLADGTMEFTADTGDGERAWRAVVTEMVPDASVGWTSRGEPVHSGVLALERVTAERTRVTLRIDHDLQAEPGDDPTADLWRLAEVVRARPGVPGERRLLSMAAVLDGAVTDPLGEPIGEIRDVYLDLDDGMVTSLAVKAGGRDSVHLVPVPPTSLEEAVNGLRLPYPADLVRSAPAAEPGVEPAADLLASAARHFADADAWGEAQESVRERQTTPAPVPALQPVMDDGQGAGVPAPTPQIAAFEQREQSDEHDEDPRPAAG